MAILKLKNENGVFVDISVIIGLQGERNPKGEGDKCDVGLQSEQGIQSEKGETDSKGELGYTPVKGTDYWTTDGKTEIIEELIKILGVAEGVNTNG